MPAAEAPRHGSVLSYSHLSYQIPSRRSGAKYIKLVDDVSVEVRPGEMLAIMVTFFFTTSLKCPYDTVNRGRQVLVRNISGVDRRRWLSFPKGKSTLLDLMAFRKQGLPGFTVCYHQDSVHRFT